MHERLVNYLRDHRDHIIETWLTEAEVPGPGVARADPGVVPYQFFAQAFDEVLTTLERGAIKAPPEQPPAPSRMNAFLGLTCACRERCMGGRVCMELHDAGLSAFMAVFAHEWDTDQEFNAFDRQQNKEFINHALSGFFGKEIDLCAERLRRDDCPFVQLNLPTQ